MSSTITVTLPLALPCDACTAEPDEPCLPGCTGLAAAQDAAEDAAAAAAHPGCTACVRLAETRDALIYAGSPAAAIYADALDLHRTGAHLPDYRTDPAAILAAPLPADRAAYDRRTRRVGAVILLAALAAFAYVMVLLNGAAPSETDGRTLPQEPPAVTAPADPAPAAAAPADPARAAFDALTDCYVDALTDAEYAACDAAYADALDALEAMRA